MNGIDRLLVDVRDAAVLTNSYVASDYELTALGQYNQVVLEIQLTLGSLTSAEVKVEYTQDGTVWAQETFSEIVDDTDTLSLGEHTMAADGTYLIALPIQTKNMRISAKGTGTVTGSSMTIRAIVGVS